jgi:hypothetical protein
VYVEMLLVAKSKQHVAREFKCSILWQNVSQNIKGYLGDGQL